ncbi:MAG: asparagine synthase-related protein [bacterium]
MSGFVVGFGNPRLEEIEKGLEKIDHRGPDIFAVRRAGKAIMAQNYLEADGPAAGGRAAIPVVDPACKDRRICYDGQVGMWNGRPVPKDIPPERLCLDEYSKNGADMLSRLGDAIFSLVICDGEDLFAARDLLGIKTLFYGWKDGTLYLCPELKALVAITDDVYEFPPGHYMKGDGKPIEYGRLSTEPQAPPEKTEDKIVEQVRSLIESSFDARVDYSRPTASLLSGGIDSSVVAALGARRHCDRYGSSSAIKTFSLGVGESEDIKNARIVAEFLCTDHEEIIVGLNDLVEALPEVIYYLEHFDPSLVRSAVSNFLVSRRAKERGVEILLSGEGGDEIFCGYRHLKGTDASELYREQIKCLEFLHSNASLRLDRMNQCSSVKVVAPLISGELLNYALSLPPDYKVRPHEGENMEKWVFRKAFENDLPDEIVWRLKQEFSQGSGSADELPQYFDDRISDAELEEAQQRHSLIRSKEELYYFRIFTENFGEGKAVETVGQWLTL